MKLQKKSLKYLLKVILCYHVSIPSPSIFHVISVLLKMRPDHKGTKWRRTKEPLDESERGEWKSWLKTQHSQNKDHGIRSHHFMANRWGNNGNSEKLILGSKITADGDCSHEIKRFLLLGRKATINLDSILKSRDVTLLTKVHLVKAMVFASSHVWMWELDHKEAKHRGIDAFKLWCWRRC